MVAVTPNGAQVALVAIADSDRLFAEALGERIDAETDFDVVSIAATAERTREVLDEGGIDVLVIEPAIDGGAGYDLIRASTQAGSVRAAVAVSSDDGCDAAIRAIAAGARAFVPKGLPAIELLAAMRGALGGETYVPPKLLTAVFARLRTVADTPPEESSGFALLTRREHELLRLLALGHDRRTIAAELGVSTHTVRTHIRRILAKLGVHSILEAVALVLRDRAALGRHYSRRSVS